MIRVLHALALSLQTLTIFLFYLTLIASNQFFLDQTILFLYHALSLTSYLAFFSGVLLLTMKWRTGDGWKSGTWLTVLFWIPPVILYFLSRSVLVFIQTLEASA